MEKKWWQYLDKPAYIVLFGGIMVMQRNFALGAIIAAVGAVIAIVYFFMQQKNS